MARCNRCGCWFSTLEDEASMHSCPDCGWPGRDEPEPEPDEDDPDEEAA